MLSLIAQKINLYEHQSQLHEQEVILSYRGPLNDVLLSELGQNIRSCPQIPNKTNKKVFTVFMELAQNVMYYSQEVNHYGAREPIGALILLHKEGCFQVFTGNLVKKSSVHGLESKCDMVNSLDKPQLREYKRELRNAPPEAESKGAGIGMVQAALISGNPLEYEFKELEDDFAFYSLKAQVSCPMLTE